MLTKPLEMGFDYEGVSVKLDIPFNNILLMYQLYADDLFAPVEKLSMSLEKVLHKSCQDKVFKLGPSTCAALLDKIITEYVNVTKQSGGQNEKTYDFEQDAGYIYASFMQDYGIDLYDQIDKLDWRKFIWLFNGLSDNTKFKEVVKIRTMKVPQVNKHNAEQVSAIMEAKAHYQLEMSQEEREAQFAQGLKALAKQFG